MQCRYCRAWNEADERRCVRCGRRADLAAPRPAPETYMGAATAPSLEPLQMPAPDQRSRPAQAPSPFPASYPSFSGTQASLFRDVSGQHKVIPIPTLTPMRPVEREESSHPKRASKPRQSSPRHSSRRTNESQQALDFNFHPAAGVEGAPGMNAGTRVQPVIYCDAPVAMPTHRLIAAAFDASMVLLSVGMFLEFSSCRADRLS